MGNVERCDKTLPTNEMMFALRRDPALRARLVSDPATRVLHARLPRGNGTRPGRPGGPGTSHLMAEIVAAMAMSHSPGLTGCLERMEEAGSGGPAELLAWILVLAFTRGPADVLAYMRAFTWRSGTGMVAWNRLA